MPLSSLLAERTRQADRRREARRLRVARAAARAAAARAAAPLVGAARRARMADRAHRSARRPLPVLLSVRGPARAPRPRDAVQLPAVARDAAQLQHHDQRLRLRAAVAAAGRADAAASSARCSRHPDVERDILAGLNAAELGRRQFREIARVAGLVFQGYPGPAAIEPPAAGVERAALRRVPEYDPDNLLLRQATREVLERQLEAPRLAPRSRACAARAPSSRSPRGPTPFAFPLMVEMFREKLTTEALEARVARMVARSRGRRAAVSVAVAAGKAILA